MIVKAGSTDVKTYFVLRLAADGTELTGATITNIDLQYVRSGAAPSAKADATALAATDSAHADNKAIEIDGTDQKGLYRVDWPDAAFAAGVREVILSVTYATAFVEHLRVDLTPVPANAIQWLGTACATPTVAGVPEVDPTHIMGTILTEGAAGRLAAAFIKLFDVATPVLTATSVNQTGDSYAIVNHGSYGNAQLVRSTTPANTFDVSATGEGGLDFDNIKAATGATTLTNITLPNVTLTATTTAVTNSVTVSALTAAALDDFFSVDSGNTYAGSVAGSVVQETADNAGGSALTVAAIADGVLDELVADHTTAGSLSAVISAFTAIGAGAITMTYTVTDDDTGLPIADADVWVTTDLAGTNVIGSGQTDSSGEVVFYLDAGNAYFWTQKDGHNFTNPDLEVIA